MSIINNNPAAGTTTARTGTTTATATAASVLEEGKKLTQEALATAILTAIDSSKPQQPLREARSDNRESTHAVDVDDGLDVGAEHAASHLPDG